MTVHVLCVACMQGLPSTNGVWLYCVYVCVCVGPASTTDHETGNHEHEESSEEDEGRDKSEYTCTSKYDCVCSRN